MAYEPHENPPNVEMHITPEHSTIVNGRNPSKG
jgi:hypothetical protein